MTLIFATHNKGKLREASEILGSQFSILSPESEGIEGEAEETASTLEGNSLLKARYIYDRSGGKPCFADDSGLEVDALGGAPGVYTARFAGPECSFEDNIDKLLSELQDVPMEKRTARFRCVVTLIADGKVSVFSGCMEGKIAFQRKGSGGFGYDPVFIPDFNDAQMTLAELGEEVKNTFSHRFQALDAMRQTILRQCLVN